MTLEACALCLMAGALAMTGSKPQQRTARETLVLPQSCHAQEQATPP